MERAVVVTVSVAVAMVLPLRVTDAGETLHVPAGGAPLQVNVTVPLKPPAGVKVMV